MDTFFIDEIVSISPQGILCRSDEKEVIIRFDECVKNFLIDYPVSSGKCVATSDILKGVYTFYTEPKTVIMVKGIKRRFFSWKWAKRVQQFVDLKKKISQQGFTTFDLT